MKVFGRSVVVLTLGLLFCAATASAEWRVDIESKTVTAGETGVTVDITAYWDKSMNNFGVPVIVREIDAGSFWAGDLPADTLLASGSAVGVEWKWPNPGWAVIIQQVRPLVGPGSHQCDPAPDTLYDGLSPDHFAISATGLSGTPAEPSGQVVLTLTFDVTSNAGEFEFDTSCYVPDNNTIFMTEDAFPPIEHGAWGEDEVVFNKGIITIQAAANQAPELDPIGSQSVDEEVLLTFGVSASDPDNDPLTLSAEDRPDGAAFTDNGDGTGTFNWTPGALQSGNYVVRFIASDGELADTELVAITVNDANAILEEEAGVPLEYELAQNYPNPFNATTRIDFTLKHSSLVSLEIFNILGQNVATPIANQYLDAGSQSATWDGQNADGQSISSGIYFYRLTTTDFVEMKKMVLTK